MGREESLKSKRDFIRLYRKGKKSVSKEMVFYALKGEEEKSRIGFSISKKNGKAVVRNRLKRQLREIFRSRKSKLNNIYDIVIVVRKASVGVPYHQLNRVFMEHCRRLKLIDSDKGDD